MRSGESAGCYLPFLLLVAFFAPPLAGAAFPPLSTVPPSPEAASQPYMALTTASLPWSAMACLLKRSAMTLAGIFRMRLR